MPLDKGEIHAESSVDGREAGAKTPGGRIQWIDKTWGGGTQTPVHILDPTGKDPEAFNVLAHALEKHHASTTPAPLSRIHYYPPRAIRKSFASGESGHRPPGDSDDEANGNISSTSSDDATPVPPLGTNSPPDPGRNMVDAPIPEDEDAGVPRARDSGFYANLQAQRIVETHVRRLGKGNPTPIKGLPVGRQHHHQRHLRESKRPRSRIIESSGIREKDIEASDDTVMKDREGSGNGILSTLLKLYEPPSPDDTSSYVSSTTASGRESPISDWYSESHLEPPTRTTTHGEDDRAGRFDDKARKRPRLPRPRVNAPFLGLVTRPSKARTGAGVFGPLIAATGSLAGVAAPHHTTLQPNLKRPGYTLSRYTADYEMPAPPASAVLSRPKSESSIERDRYSPVSAEKNLVSLSLNSPVVDSPGEVEGNLKRPYWFPNLSKESFRYPGRRSGRNTPASLTSTGDREDHYFSSHTKKKSSKRSKRRKDEVFITKHVAQIIQREEFILKLTRAMMMFGGPSHRLQFQIQSAARVLDITLGFLYLPDVALISFEDLGTGTSHIKLIRQPSSLDIGKLSSAFHLYWRVIHDKLSVGNASKSLDTLMRKPVLYNWWELILIGGMCSSSICTVSFGGSFLDAVISFPLGACLVAIQLLSVRNVLYAHVFEITITMFCSFIAAALAATQKFCYSAVASSSVVLILPGFLVLTASLELTSRNIVSGSVRICYAIAYALFLGFGFSIGAQMFHIITGHQIYGSEDYVCSASHPPGGPWYQRTPDRLWAILTVPMFSTFLSLKNQAPWNCKEFVVLVLISCIGWITNYFTGLKFPGQSDIIAAVGAFAVGIVANVYAKMFSGNAFVVMITGILFQLPSGLGTGGLLSYATEQAQGSTTSYLSAFMVSLKLVSVAIGLAIGLSLALVITHPIQSKKREGGIFSL